MQCAWASRAATIRHPSTRDARHKLHKRLDELIAAAFGDVDAKGLIKRLRRHRDEMLIFLDHEGVSPYKNHAEQQMRTAVHTRKVSQQNRSQQGAKTHAIFLSLFRSAQLLRINPVEHVLQLARNEISAQPTGTIAPAQFRNVNGCPNPPLLGDKSKAARSFQMRKVTRNPYPCQINRIHAGPKRHVSNKTRLCQRNDGAAAHRRRNRCLRAKRASSRLKSIPP